MNQKIIAFISYITIIGWVIAFGLSKAPKFKTPFVLFHLRQSLGLFVTGIVVYILDIFTGWLPFFSLGYWLLGLGVFIGIIAGAYSALNESNEKTPLIGWIYQESFPFLK